MAPVQHLRPAAKAQPRIHSPVGCTACTFRGEDGATCVPLDTVGSTTRQEKGSRSQTMQFDEKGARALLDLIRKAFPGLS